MRGQVITSTEKQFLYHDSFNRGTVEVPSMVQACIGLSSQAKDVYANIYRHVFERGKSAFPSVYLLAMQCGCSVNSVTNYIQELHDKGLIEKVSQGRGKSNLYYIRDLHEVNLLHVSEMLYIIMHELKGYGWDKLVQARNKMLKFMDKEGYSIEGVVVSDESKQMLKHLLITIMEGGALEVGLLPKNVKYIPKTEVVEQEPQVSKTQDDFKPKRTTALAGINKNHWRIKEVDDWEVAQFKEYYYDKYLDTLGHVHPRNERKHAGMIRRVLKNLEGDRHALKKYIDAVFEIGYDNLSLDLFSSSHRLSEIQSYIANGTKPFYIEKNKSRDKTADVVPVNQGNKLDKEGLDKLLRGDRP